MSRQTDRQLQRIHGQPGTAIAVSVNGTSAQSSALTARVTYMLCATEDCHILFGSNPTATTSSTFLPAGVPWPVTILDDGTTYKVAAIQKDTAGTLTITPMSGVHA